jgi:hypothetical protein
MIAAAGLVAAALAVADGGAPAPERAARGTPTPTPTPRPKHTPRAHCPSGVTGCVAVRGRVVYVERVDPDGDGDLHVVVLAGGVTLPDLTSIDVARELRPRRDPRVGDVVAAAGPVQIGHIGQRQVHALVFRTSR